MKLTALMFALMSFASVNTDLPVPEKPPIVKQISSEQLWYLIYNKEYDPNGDHQVLGAYRNGIIFLSHDFTPKSVKDTGDLLHELVHYMQDMSEEQYACNGNKEHEAHSVQFDYYRGAGVEDPMEYVGMNPLFYRLRTRCHPALQGSR